MNIISNRQIHLDFHTSGLISDVAGDFDAGAFAATLKEACVAGICLFARCHHGYCYYPTSVGTAHPFLKEPNLLGLQLKACKDAGIDTYLYTTICWDELSAENHPEWLCLTSDNKVMKMDPFTGEEMGSFEPGWRFLCWNSPYREYFREHLEEVLSRYEFENLFLDIMFNRTPCVCKHCVERMRKNGLAPENTADIERNSIDSAREFMKYINDAVYKIQPNAKPFYNARLRVSGIVEDCSRPELPMQGYLCIESLPSGPWGYDHFPIFAKYFQNFAAEKQIVGHTGKFQKMWGDFGGLKNQAALDYEVMRMLSHGVAACVGDQLHPKGALDKATYKLIGNTFAKIKPVENELLGSMPIDEIGVLFTNQPKQVKNIGTKLDAETGVMKMLMQLQYQFSFIDEDSEFGRYKVIILPDEVTLNEKLKRKLNEYLDGGGKLFLTYISGNDPCGKWQIHGFDISNDCSEYNPYYMYPAEDLLNYGVADTDHIQYLGGRKIVSYQKSYKILASVTEPYFNRQWNHFCSHAQTPPARRTDVPAIIYNNKNAVYFAAPVFTCYNKYSSKSDKLTVDYCLRLLLGEKLIESNLPSTAEVTLRRSAEGQLVLTILNYVHQRRGEGLDIVEDCTPLHDVAISIPDKLGITDVCEVRTGNSISLTKSAGRLCFTIGKVDGFGVVRCL